MHNFLIHNIMYIIIHYLIRLSLLPILVFLMLLSAALSTITRILQVPLNQVHTDSYI